jgi:hypothetical protein
MLFLLAALVAAEASLDAGVGLHGERRTAISARAGDEELRISLGAAQFSGLQAPERHELSVSAETPLFRGELKVVPVSAGLLRVAAEAGVHSETMGLVLAARAVSLGRTSLRAIGARAELEGTLTEGVRAGGSATVWALQLDAPRSADPWAAYGAATLDWGERWEAGAWISKELGDVSLTPGLSAAQSTALEARASFAAEIQLGPVKLRVEAALGRARSALQGDVACGLTLAL